MLDHIRYYVTLESQIHRFSVLNSFSHPAIDIRLGFLQAHGPQIHKLLGRRPLTVVAVIRNDTCSWSVHCENAGTTVRLLCCNAHTDCAYIPNNARSTSVLLCSNCQHDVSLALIMLAEPVLLEALRHTKNTTFYAVNRGKHTKPSQANDAKSGLGCIQPIQSLASCILADGHATG